MKFMDKEIIPVSPVFLSSSELTKEEIGVAKNQPEYRVLPMVKYKSKDGSICGLTRWKFPLWQRLVLLFTGNLFIEYKFADRPIQPLYMNTKDIKCIS